MTPLLFVLGWLISLYISEYYLLPDRKDLCEKHANRYWPCERCKKENLK